MILLLAIFINFLSQFLGYWANYEDYLMCEIKLIPEENRNKKDVKDLIKHDKKSNNYTTATNWSNVISAVLMFVGLFLLLRFFMITF